MARSAEIFAFLDLIMLQNCLKCIKFRGFLDLGGAGFPTVGGGWGGDPPHKKKFGQIPPHKTRNPPPIKSEISGGGSPPTSAGAKRRKKFYGGGSPPTKCFDPLLCWREVPKISIFRRKLQFFTRFSKKLLDFLSFDPIFPKMDDNFWT